MFSVVRTSPFSESPTSERVRLDVETVPITWPAAAFSLLVGLTMVLVPYEFQARLFRSIYPQIRLLGLGFLFGGLALVLAALYPKARWADRLGRLAFLVALGMYWWEAKVLRGSLTGALVYPLLMLGVAAEAHRRFATGGLLGWFFALLGLSFGGLMLLSPGSFAPSMFALLTDVIRPVGVLFLVLAAALMLLLFRRRREGRWVYLVFAALFAFVAYGLGRRSWAGTELYLVLATTAVLVTIGPRVRRTADLRAKLLRSMAVAGLLPLFAVGGLASYFAQRELEASLRRDIARATAAESEWLSQLVGRARAGMVELAEGSALVAAVDRRDRVALEDILRRALGHKPLLEALFVQDPAGNRWAAVGESERGDGFGNRLYHRQVMDSGQPFVSPPFASEVGTPTVVVAVPIAADGGNLGVLGGALSLNRVAHTPSTASAPYRIQVTDARTGQVLRDTSGGPLLGQAALSGLLFAPTRSARTRTVDVFDEENRRLLVAHAPVASSDWLVLASQDVASAYAPLTRVSGVVAAIVVIAGGLAVLLSGLLAREFAARIGAVQAAARDLAEGDLGRRVTDQGGPDELGTLAEGFNRMADRLQESQAALARINEELRQSLAARDALTATLQRADRRKDEFLAMLAHELRNPLAALNTALQTLERATQGGRGAPLERVLAVGRRQMRNLTRMVDDLLDVSRIASNKIALRRERVDIRVPVQNAIESVAQRASAQDQQLSIDLPAAPLWVEGDSTRFEQIVANLLSNAVKYTDVGGQILIKAWRDGDGHSGRVRLEVRDTGRGIPPELLPQVFDLFVQGESTLDRREGGLGLGLTLVRRLVELHGGRVTAASAGPGRGSTFTVELPAAPAHAEQAPASSEPAAVYTEARRIVLVDDNEDAAVLLKELLETYGHEVALAHDGECGRDLILARRPDLAFVDLGLPRLDGFEVARQVRSAGVGVGTRLVALTGYGGAEVRHRALEAGFDEHVVKPLDPDRIEELLG
jgi:signal transduction histidine kinase